MKLYIMRHGTTVWNEKEIIQGFSKNRLSKSGKLLVEKQAVKHKNTNFDLIIASPMMRTMQTANIMNKFHGIKIVKDDRLREIDQGVFTGRKMSSLTDEEKPHQLKKNPKYGMENYESVLKRVVSFYEYLKTLTSYKNVLVVTHNTPASYLESLIIDGFVDISNRQKQINFGNAEIKEFEI